MTPDYYVSQMKVYSRFVLNMNPAQRAKDQMLKIAVGPGTPDTEWTEAVMKAWKKHTWAWDINGVSLHWYTVPNGWPPSTPRKSSGWTTTRRLSNRRCSWMSSCASRKR
jgi:alpha-N-arabinofuranosidase